ncbi:hypothetical protein CYMTET_17265 [Cymbomonas tetramitiformis]|uniref:Uncharacterized protein n=1 Tax=Cymbomonas tetramitiformis TaxID=36881 RepID=A0AAE0GAG7_9CHLO|nr:hypothetical protein CYMTET_17265 [Cymbomonas tetramitiformis]
MGIFGYLRRSRSRAKAVNDLPLEPAAERETHRDLLVSPASAATDDDSHPATGPSARSDFDVDSSEVWQRIVAACIPLRITWSSEGGPPGTGNSAYTLLDCFLNLRVQYVCVDALRATPDLWSFMWLPAFCAFAASACNVYIFQGDLLLHLHLMMRGAVLSYGYVLVASAVLWRILKQTKRAVTVRTPLPGTGPSPLLPCAPPL